MYLMEGGYISTILVDGNIELFILRKRDPGTNVKNQQHITSSLVIVFGLVVALSYTPPIAVADCQLKIL